MFMISDFKIFLNIETAEFWHIVGLTSILRLLQRKNYTLFNLQLLLLLSEI